MRTDAPARPILGLGALVLTTHHYLVMDGHAQQWATRTLHRTLGATVPVWGEWLYEHPELVANGTWALASIFIFGLLPLSVMRLVWGVTPTNLGWRRPVSVPWRGLGALTVALIGVVVLTSQLESFRAVYPFFRARELWPNWIAFEVLYVLQFVALESFFRGVLLHGLEPELGRLSVWVAALPYVMVHFQKPWPEAAGALLAAVILGELSLRTRSIWPGVFLHCTAAITMDLAAMA